MTSLEEQVQHLREKNVELVEKAQYWKMLAADRENEKVELMKEINHLRLKLCRIRNASAKQKQGFAKALEETTQQTISYLFQATETVTKTFELTKSFADEIPETEYQSPRWSNLSSPGNRSDKVKKVAPMIGGRTIQPVVTLIRTPINNTSSQSLPNITQNRSLSERTPLPMHLLQDLYIPLRRIDSDDVHNEDESVHEDSTEDLELDESHMEGLDNIEEEDTENMYNEQVVDVSTNVLEVLPEESEEQVAAPLRDYDPLEGPSNLLDANVSLKSGRRKTHINHEPDSTTETVKPLSPRNRDERFVDACSFSPTIRRRKRTSPPAVLSPAAVTPTQQRTSNKYRISGPVLKVLIPKMRLEVTSPQEVKKSFEGLPNDVHETPPKRMMRFDAPSPNGATDRALMVTLSKEVRVTLERNTSAVSDTSDDRSKVGGEGAGEGDGGGAEEAEGRGERGEARGGRGRRKRKQVVYKEKPLNRKLRR